MSEQMKKARLAKNWSQYELSDESGVPRSRITQLENGSEPGVRIAIKLARALKTTVEKLWPTP
jgi:transcriptional regulator with XRE-family HTH domain